MPVMTYRWLVYYLGRELGRIQSNRDDGPAIADWLVRETLGGDVAPGDVQVVPVRRITQETSRSCCSRS